MTLRFYTRKKNGKVHIYCCISHEGNEKHIGLGYSLPDSKYWDAVKKRVKNHEVSGDINVKILRWESDFEAYVAKCKRGEADFVISEAAALLQGGRVEKKKHFLLDYAVEYFDVKKRTTKQGTYKQYNAVIQDLRDYEEQVGDKVKVSDVGRDFWREFGLFLIEEKDNVNSTVNKKISRLMSVMTWLFEKGVIHTQDYAKKHTFKSHPSKRFPLRPEEVSALWKMKTIDGWDGMILRAFLFCCETGLRFSDAKQLQRHHIKQVEGIQYIDLTEIKTDDVTNPPLSKRALDILSYSPETGHLFQLTHTQSANRTLRSLAQLAGLDRQIEVVQAQGAETIRSVEPLYHLISFHFARNTYITNLLANGLAPVYVQDNAGHADLKTTLGYSKQDDLKRWRETLKVQDSAGA